MGGEKGLTAYHKDDWLIAEAYGDEGKCVICIYFKIFGHINDEDAATLDKENFPKGASTYVLQERSLMFLIAGYGPRKIGVGDSLLVSLLFL